MCILHSALLVCSRMFILNKYSYGMTPVNRSRRPQLAENRLLSQPLRDLRVMYALHLLLDGKLMVDFLFVIIELFAVYYGWDVISRNLSEVGVFRRRWITWSANFRRKGASPTNHCWFQKTEWLPFRVVSKYPQRIVWFCQKHACDRWTDRQTELRLPRLR